MVFEHHYSAVGETEFLSACLPHAPLVAKRGPGYCKCWNGHEHLARKTDSHMVGYWQMLWVLQGSTLRRGAAQVVEAVSWEIVAAEIYSNGWMDNLFSLSNVGDVGLQHQVQTRRTRSLRVPNQWAFSYDTKQGRCQTKWRPPAAGAIGSFGLYNPFGWWRHRLSWQSLCGDARRFQCWGHQGCLNSG